MTTLSIILITTQDWNLWRKKNVINQIKDSQSNERKQDFVTIQAQPHFLLWYICNFTWKWYDTNKGSSTCHVVIVPIS